MRLGRTAFFQRLWLCLSLCGAFVLTGCGASGVKFNEFLPQRIILIGDEISYVGCAKGTSNGQDVCAGIDNFDRFTINSSSSSTPLSNNWVIRLAFNYGLTTDKIIEPLVPGYASKSAAQITAAARTIKLGARATAPLASSPTWTSVSDQASLIPSYVKGDMVVVAGGANDVLTAVMDSGITSPAPSKRGINIRRQTDGVALYDAIISNLGINSLSQGQAYYIMTAAQAYQDIALDLIRNKGQQNVFMAPVYDFSNSPDLSNFCTGSCTSTKVKQGVALFNYVQRLLTDNSFEPMTFNSGEPHILTSSGSSSYDLLYVNLPFFTTVFRSAVYNYDVAHSVCGISSTLATRPTDVTGCNWNGLFATSNSVDPVFNGTTYASGSTYPDFLVNQGKYVYAIDQYLTPTLHVTMGDTIAVFMRGYNGW